MAPVLEEKGKLYLSIGNSSVSTIIANKLEFSKTEVIPFDGIAQSTSEVRRITVHEFSFGIRKFDIVLAFWDVLNFDAVRPG